MENLKEMNFFSSILSNFSHFRKLFQRNRYFFGFTSDPPYWCKLVLEFTIFSFFFPQTKNGMKIKACDLEAMDSEKV